MPVSRSAKSRRSSTKRQRWTRTRRQLFGCSPGRCGTLSSSDEKRLPCSNRLHGAKRRASDRRVAARLPSVVPPQAPLVVSPSAASGGSLKEKQSSLAGSVSLPFVRVATERREGGFMSLRNSATRSKALGG